MSTKVKLIIILYVSMCICSVFAMQDVDLKGYECKESIIENEYYDRIDMYYNKVEIEYNDTILQAISDYYLVAYKNGEKIILGYFGFQESKGEPWMYGRVLDSNGDKIYRTRISGSLYNSGSTIGNLIIYGFDMSTLERPLAPVLLLQKRNLETAFPVKNEDGFVRCIIDNEAHMLRQFTYYFR